MKPPIHNPDKAHQRKADGCRKAVRTRVRNYRLSQAVMTYEKQLMCWKVVLRNTYGWKATVPGFLDFWVRDKDFETCLSKLKDAVRRVITDRLSYGLGLPKVREQ